MLDTWAWAYYIPRGGYACSRLKCFASILERKSPEVPVAVLLHMSEKESEIITENSINEQWVDTNGNPAGGINQGVGFTISWQNGPLNRGADRKEPNGAFVENVIKAVIDRLEFYQSSKFKSSYNEDAIADLKCALKTLNQRTID